MDYGWKKDDNYIVPKLMSSPAVPSNIRKIISLNCSEKKCDTKKCVCLVEGVFCTEECKCCSNCSNKQIIGDIVEDYDFVQFSCLLHNNIKNNKGDDNNNKMIIILVLIIKIK